MCLNLRGSAIHNSNTERGTWTVFSTVDLQLQMYVATYKVQFGREVGVHEPEEEVPERPDLGAACHVHTLRAQGDRQGEVGPREGEDRQREHFLGTAERGREGGREAEGR